MHKGRLRGKVMKKMLWPGVALVVLLALAIITGFQPLYWLLYLMVVGAATGFLWVRLQGLGLDTRAEVLSLHPQVGHQAHVRVTVRERAGLPRLGLRGRLTDDFASMTEETFNLSPRGTATWTVSGRCQRRGLNPIGSMTLMSGDPTGLMCFSRQVGEPQTILVYPATVELSRTVLAGHASSGEIEEAGPSSGSSPAASMLRQYVPGDGLTRIHWPTTARLDQLMTKEFEGGAINEVWLFVDLQESISVGTGDDSTEEYSITIAASLANGLIEDGNSVALVAQGDQLYRVLPRKDASHLWALMRALAMARALGRTPLARVMAREAGNLGSGTVAIIIAPQRSQGLESIYQFLSRRGVLVVSIALDTASFGGSPGHGWAGDGLSGAKEWTALIKRGDDLSVTLGNLLHRLASY